MDRVYLERIKIFPENIFVKKKKKLLAYTILSNQENSSCPNNKYAIVIHIFIEYNYIFEQLCQTFSLFMIILYMLCSQNK